MLEFKFQDFFAYQGLMNPISHPMSFWTFWHKLYKKYSNFEEYLILVKNTVKNQNINQALLVFKYKYKT